MDAGNSQKSDPEKLSSALAMAVLIAVSFSLLAATAWSQADPEVAALIQRLKDKNTNVKVRRNAALALGFMKANQKEAVPALVAALKDQLGLDLKQKTAPAEMLIVDYVERVGGGN